MRVISVNVNGIRAAHRKNFFSWLKTQNADVVCIQETKAQVDQLTEEIIKPEGYYSYFNSAVKKGYSGVAIYTRVKPDKVIDKIGKNLSQTVDKETEIINQTILQILWKSLSNNSHKLN